MLGPSEFTYSLKCWFTLSFPFRVRFYTSFLIDFHFFIDSTTSNPPALSPCFSPILCNSYCLVFLVRTSIVLSENIVLIFFFTVNLVVFSSIVCACGFSSSLKILSGVILPFLKVFPDSYFPVFPS